MRWKSALAGFVVAASLAVGATAHAANAAPTVVMSSPLGSYSPLAVSPQNPFANPAPTTSPLFLSSELASLNAGRNPLQNFAMTAAIAPGVALNVGSNLGLTGRFNGYDLSANNFNDGLFLSSSAAPYATLTSGGDFVGATVALASDLHFSVGHSSLEAPHSNFDVPLFSFLTQPDGLRDSLSPHSAQSTLAGVDWNFAPWAGLGVNASNTVEKNSLLGNVNASARALSANTNAVGASAHVSFGGGWVTTVSFNQGVTQLDLKTTSNLLGTTVDTRAYSISVAKHGLFAENDSLGLAVSRPIQLFAGHLGVPSVAGFDTGNRLTNDNTPLLGAVPETDLELGYVTSFFNGALNLQANAAYQFNAEGQSGTNSLAVLSRAKINF